MKKRVRFLIVPVVVVLCAAVFAACCPVSSAVRAFDMTEAVPHSDTFYASMYADGYRLVVMHDIQWSTLNTTCDAWPNIQQQVADALAAGLGVGIYSRNPNCWSNAIDALGGYKGYVQFFVLDIETDPGVAPTRAMVDGIKAKGMQPVIYTGSGMWPSITGNSTAFSDVPLWDVGFENNFNYSTWLSGTPDCCTPTETQYGGWNTGSNYRWGVQQQLNVTAHGHTFDVSVFDASKVHAP